jgi:putative peptidoglycan lipid II flippase
VTRPAVPVAATCTEPQRPASQPGLEIGRAAAMIAVLTVAGRAIGLVRQLVFARTVGSASLGTAYATANLVPNVIYDIVMGGALTAVIVPLLARPAGLADTGERAGELVSRISSALLTWTVAILLPVSVIVAVAANQIIATLVPAGPRSPAEHAQIVAAGGQMLTVFAPQILLYGVAVVLYGILQAHRAFTAPALAPVLSSLVVIAAYLVFAVVAGPRPRLAGLPAPAELTLAAGTTAGVAALALTAVWPARRLGLRLRPALRFPPGVARRARGLAAAGITVLVAQDASVLAVTWLANGHGGTGAVVLYTYGWQIFSAAYAILAVPVAVSAFPLLSARAGRGFDATTAASARAVLLTSWLGAAALAGVAIPAARLFVHQVPGLSAAAAGHQQGELAVALVALAPGLVGYGLTACLYRVLLADRRSTVAAWVISAGWLAVTAADVAVVPLVPPDAVIPAMAAASSVGLTISALALLAAVRRARGAGALRGTVRAFAVGMAGALAGGVAGAAVSGTIRAAGFLPDAGIAVVALACTLAAFAAVVWAMDSGDARAALGRLGRRAA